MAGNQSLKWEFQWKKGVGFDYFFKLLRITKHCSGPYLHFVPLKCGTIIPDIDGLVSEGIGGFTGQNWLVATKRLALIARFMGPTWGHLGPTGPRWAPCWPHELCYLGDYSGLWLNETKWYTYAWVNWVINDAGNGCCLLDTKPLPEPMLTYYQVDRGNISLWTFNQKKDFCHENRFENVIWTMSISMC